MFKFLRLALQWLTTPRLDFTQPAAVVSLGVLRAEMDENGIKMSNLRLALIATIAAGAVMTASTGFYIVGIGGFRPLYVASIAYLACAYLIGAPTDAVQPFNTKALYAVGTVIPLLFVCGYVLDAYIEKLMILSPLAVLDLATIYFFIYGAANALLALRIFCWPKYHDRAEVYYTVSRKTKWPDLAEIADRDVFMRVRTCSILTDRLNGTHQKELAPSTWRIYFSKSEAGLSAAHKLLNEQIDKLPELSQKSIDPMQVDKRFWI